MTYLRERQVCPKCGMPPAAGERLDRCVLCKVPTCEGCAASWLEARPRCLPICAPCNRRLQERQDAQEEE